MTNAQIEVKNITQLPLPAEEILQDYRRAYQSRQASLIGRREVMSGKAKFGIFGDGKELPQLALARAFQKGDFRSGYYRDQTFMFASGMSTLREFFAQLYAHTDLDADPATAGRSMNAHFATRSLNPDGSWKDLTIQFNSAADLSPTARTDAAPGGTGLCIQNLPRTGYIERFYAVFKRRAGSCVWYDRQRQLR